MAGEITVIPWANISPASTAAGSAEVIIKEGSTFSRITKDNLLADVSSPAIAGTIDFTVTETVENVTGPTLNAVEGPRYTAISGDVTYLATFVNGYMLVPAQTDPGPSYRCTGLGVLESVSGANSKNYANFLFGNFAELLLDGAGYAIIGTPNGNVMNINALIVAADGILMSINHLTNTPTVLAGTFDPADPFRVYWDVAANTIKVETVSAGGVSAYVDITPTVPLAAGVAAMVSIQGTVASPSEQLTLGISGVNNFGTTFTTLEGYTAPTSTLSTATVTYPAIPLLTKENMFYKATVGVSPQGGGYVNPDNSEVIIEDGDVVAITKNGGGAFVVGNVIPGKQKDHLTLQPTTLSLANTSEEVATPEPAAFLTRVVTVDYPGGILINPDTLQHGSADINSALAVIGDPLAADTKAAVYMRINAVFENSDPINYPGGVVNLTGMMIGVINSTTVTLSGLLMWKEGSGLILKDILGGTETVVDALAAFNTPHLVHLDVPLNKIIVKNDNGVFEVTPYVPLAVGHRVYAHITTSMSAAGLATGGNAPSVTINAIDWIPSGLTLETGYTLLQHTNVETVIHPPVLPVGRQTGYLYEVSVAGVWTNSDATRIRFNRGDLALILDDTNDLENITNRGVVEDATDTATFHPVNHTTGLTLSDDLLTVTHGSGEVVVTGTMTATGKRQYEIVPTGTMINVGLVDSTQLAKTIVSLQQAKIATLVGTGSAYSVITQDGFGSSTAYTITNAGSLALGVGVTIGVTYYSTTGLVEFFVNGVKVITSIPVYFPYYYNTTVKPMYHGIGDGGATVNFGATPFAYPQSTYLGYAQSVKKYNGYPRLVSTDWNPNLGYPSAVSTPIAGDLHYAKYGGTIGDEVFVEGSGVIYDGAQWRRITEIVPMEGLIFLGDYPATRPNLGYDVAVPNYVEGGVYRVAYQIRYKEDGAQTLSNYFVSGSTIVGRNGKWEYLTVSTTEYDDGYQWPVNDVAGSGSGPLSGHPMLALNSTSSDDKTVGIYEFRVRNTTPYNSDYELIVGVADGTTAANQNSKTTFYVSLETGAVMLRQAGGSLIDVTSTASTPQVPIVVNDVITFVFESVDGSLSGAQLWTVYKNGFPITAVNYIPDHTQYGKGPFWAPFTVQVNAEGNTADAFDKITYNTGKVPFKYAPTPDYYTVADLGRWVIPAGSEKSARIRIYPMSLGIIEVPANLGGGYTEDYYAGGISSGIGEGQYSSLLTLGHAISIKDTYGRVKNSSAAISTSHQGIVPVGQPAMNKTSSGVVMIYPGVGENITTLRNDWELRKRKLFDNTGSLLNGGAALASINNGFGADHDWAIDSSTGSLYGPKLYGSWNQPLTCVDASWVSDYLSLGGLRYTKPANSVFTSGLYFGLNGVELNHPSVVAITNRPSKHTVLIRMKSILRDIGNQSECWAIDIATDASIGFSTIKTELALYRYHDRMEIVGLNGTTYNQVVTLPWVTGTDEVWGIAFDELADTITIIKPDQSTLPLVTLTATEVTHKVVRLGVIPFGGSNQYGDSFEMTLEDINNPALSGYIVAGYGDRIAATEPMAQYLVTTSLKALEIVVNKDGHLVYADWKMSDLTSGEGQTMVGLNYGHGRKFTVVNYGYNFTFTVYDDAVPAQQLMWSITPPAGVADGGNYYLTYFDGFRLAAPYPAGPAIGRGFIPKVEKVQADYAYRDWAKPPVPTWAKPGTLIEASEPGGFADHSFNIRALDIILVGTSNQLYRFVPVGGDVDDTTLIAWARSKAYSQASVARDAANGYRLTGGTVTWPDGRSGVYTVTAWEAIDNTIPISWTLTYNGNSAVRTITQPTISYDGNGRLFWQPNMTVS